MLRQTRNHHEWRNQVVSRTYRMEEIVCALYAYVDAGYCAYYNYIITDIIFITFNLITQNNAARVRFPKVSHSLVG